MNFDLTEEQGLLRDLVLRFGSDHYDASKRLAYLRESGGFSRKNWILLAETGLLGFALAEADGGFGGSDADIITVMEALGDFAAVEPVLSSVILGIGAISEAGTAEQRERLLPALVAGERFAAFALYERGGRYNSDRLSTKALGNGDGIVLRGSKQMVLGGAFATDLVVAARDSDHGDIALYLVDAETSGLVRRDYRLADGSVASDIDFQNVSAQPMTGGEQAIQTVLARARLAICGELVGLMGLMLRETLDYLKTRQQFGQALGSFQAIQHRMAECYAKVELSRSQLYRAAGQDGNEGDVRQAAIHGAKAYIGESAMHVGEEAVQLHGGIGTTEELLVGQAFKRVFTLASLFGDADAELRHYIAQTAEAV